MIYLFGISPSFFVEVYILKKEYVVLGIFVLLFITSGFWLFRIINEYGKAAREYEELQEYVDDSLKKEKEETEDEKPQKTSIDFEALKEINSDIVAWIRIPEVFDYPVVQGEDNQYYLSHTFRKESNKAGSIFLDYRNSRDFTDSKSIIYGHNMKDKTMFHVLRNFQDMDFYNKHREIWIYLPDGSTQVYEIVKYEEVKATGEVYEMVNGSIEEKEIILSTCTSRLDYRAIVIASFQLTE